MCLVHPEDRELLGIKRNQQFYFDKCLPFGLRSSPYLVAGAIEKALRYNYDIKSLVRFLDDFHIAGPASTLTCAWFVDGMLALCSRVGVPVKSEWPNHLHRLPGYYTGHYSHGNTPPTR